MSFRRNAENLKPKPDGAMPSEKRKNAKVRGRIHSLPFIENQLPPDQVGKVDEHVLLEYVKGTPRTSISNARRGRNQ